MSSPAKIECPVDWDAVRACFPAASACTYLNTAGGGPMSSTARAAVLEYYEGMYARGDIGWPDWRDRVEVIRAQLARFLNAGPEDVAFCGNASAALNFAAAIAPPGEVLTGADEFPSVIMPWIVRGRTVRYAESDETGMLTAERLERSMTPRTRVLALSHVQYASGARLDVKAIGALCRDRGVMFVCDATQSIGAFPFDVENVRPDVLVFSGYKWACAGYGIAGLYVSSAYRDWTTPPLAGWRSAESPHALESRSPEFTRDARAFELGHPPVPGVFALGGALEMTASVGIERVEARIHQLADHLHAGLDAGGFELTSPRGRGARSGIAMIRIHDPERAGDHLKNKGIFISIRGGKLRVSLHLFNDEADIEHLLAVLDELRQHS